MNALKLLIGWLFLAGLTAAGTFYAMDELDHRVGLARFNLYEKLGVVQYASAPAPPAPSPATPTPVPVNPNPPPGPQPPISNPAPVPPVANPNPAPGTVAQPPSSNPPPGPANPYTNPDPRKNPVAPYTNPNPRNSASPNPVNPNPVSPPPNQQPTRPVYVPTQQPAPSRPADFDEVNARYIDLNGQTDAMAKFVDSVRRSVGSAGTGRLDGPMSSLRSAMRTAKQALDSGNTQSAKVYLDQAEKYLQALRTLKEE